MSHPSSWSPLCSPLTTFLLLLFYDPCRRGSNVSLTLDMCTPGCNEEGFGYLVSPREESAHEYLLSASRVLRAEELHEKALDPFLLQAEFFVSPSKWPPTFVHAVAHHLGQSVLECTAPNME